MRRLGALLGRFLALSLAEKRLLLDAALTMARVRWIVARRGAAPFRRAFAADDADSELNPVQRHRVRQTARMVQAARWLVPGRCNCLHLALVAHHLLRRRRIPASVRVGVRTEGKELQAHAWVQAGSDLIVDGADSCGSYCELVEVANGIGTGRGGS